MGSYTTASYLEAAHAPLRAISSVLHTPYSTSSSVHSSVRVRKSCWICSAIQKRWPAARITTARVTAIREASRTKPNVQSWIGKPKFRTLYSPSKAAQKAGGRVYAANVPVASPTETRSEKSRSEERRVG